MTGPDNLNVGDPVTFKTRLLSRQCDTCVFHPGNLMHLSPGRLAELVRRARADESYIVCHDTLPYGPYPEAQPAICRGFHDRYQTRTLQLMALLWGFNEVDPSADRSATVREPPTPLGPMRREMSSLAGDLSDRGIGERRFRSQC